MEADGCVPAASDVDTVEYGPSDVPSASSSTSLRRMVLRPRIWFDEQVEDLFVWMQEHRGVKEGSSFAPRALFASKKHVVGQVKRVCATSVRARSFHHPKRRRPRRISSLLLSPSSTARVKDSPREGGRFSPRPVEEGPDLLGPVPPMGGLLVGACSSSPFVAGDRRWSVSEVELHESTEVRLGLVWDGSERAHRRRRTCCACEAAMGEEKERTEELGEPSSPNRAQAWLRRMARMPWSKEGRRKRRQGSVEDERMARLRTSVDPLQRAATVARETSQLMRDRNQPLPGVPEYMTDVDTERRKVRVGEGERRIHVGTSQPEEGYCTNRVVTAKYNLLTFLPRFLYEMFTRAAYLYFLIQAVLSWISVISPFSGVGSTLALVFVLLVAAIKALVEDRKRHEEDRTLNNSVAHVVGEDGKVTDKKWEDVKVGEILQVYDEESFPADLLCIYSDLPDDVCFIKTANLDGETNLKIKRPARFAVDVIQRPEELSCLKAKLVCEAPNANLHVFHGVLQGESQQQLASNTLPITMNEVLLRGCTLKNSRFIYGVVIYTGGDTRIMRNQAVTPTKVGVFDKFLSVQIVILLIVQFFLCLACSIVSYVWAQEEGLNNYYLALDQHVQGNFENGFVYIIVFFFTFWILFSYLVPISLFVSMEIVKFWQGLYILMDEEMRDFDTGEPARARNSALNEDLGQVEYVFSDKTGTLTTNDMRLREISIRADTYGRKDFQLEKFCGNRRKKMGMPALQAFDERLHARLYPTLKGIGGTEASPELPENDDVFEFFVCICLCHSLIVEQDPYNAEVGIYQGASPDEVALVQAARDIGFEFVQRSSSSVTLSLHGALYTFEVLSMLEFSSERQRMSVIIRWPNGKVKLYCKGSDAIMLGLLAKEEEPLLTTIDDQLLHYSTGGLRTLVFGYREMELEEWEEWDDWYQNAALESDFEVREKEMVECAKMLEQDLRYLGVSAIEDKLQDGVPEAIDCLKQAGMKVWMITGDKKETAINIAISCRLILDREKLLMCLADKKEVAKEVLESLLKQRTSDASGRDFTGIRQELLIDGKTLTFVIGDRALEMAFARIADGCNGVVVCRSSPKQKAAIVHIMSEYRQQMAAEGSRTRIQAYWRKLFCRLNTLSLAIGDGANDVAMLQAANVGVGIAGKEGRQAVNNADYAFTQFRFLVRLLLVHGQLSQYRIARLIKYSFYKNIAFGCTLFIAQFFSGFSGQALIDSISAAFYNVVFTSVPVLLFAVLDMPLTFETLMHCPQIYNRIKSLSTFTFWKSVLDGILHGAVDFLIPYYGLRNLGVGRNSLNGLYAVGRTSFVALTGTVNLEIALVARHWTWLFGIFTVLSFVLVFPFFVVLEGLYRAFDIPDPAQWGVTQRLFASPAFWLLVCVSISVTFGHRFCWLSTKRIFFPGDQTKLAVMEQAGVLDKAAVSRRLSTLSPRNGHDSADSVQMNGTTSSVGSSVMELSTRQLPEIRHDDSVV